jgi:hypothetical protein
LLSWWWIEFFSLCTTEDWIDSCFCSLDIFEISSVVGWSDCIDLVSLLMLTWTLCWELSVDEVVQMSFPIRLRVFRIQSATLISLVACFLIQGCVFQNDQCQYTQTNKQTNKQNRDKYEL